MLTRLSLFLTITILGSAAAAASETQTYSYDSLGRLVSVSRSGTVNNGVQSRYGHDGADNRVNLTVTGTGRGAPAVSGGARATAPRPATNASTAATGR